MEYRKDRIDGMRVDIFLNICTFTYICAWVLVPAFRNMTNSGGFVLVFLGVIISWLLSSLSISYSSYKKNAYILLAISPYFIFIFLYYVIGFGDMKLNDCVNLLLIIIFFLIGSFYNDLNNAKIDKVILRIILTFFFVTAITSIYNLNIDGNVARYLTTESLSGSEHSFLRSRNIGAFDFIYGTLFLLPGLIILYKSTIRNRNHGIAKFKILLLICILIITILIIKSNFMIALFFLIIAYMLFLMPTQLSLTKQIVIISIGAIIVYFFLKSIIVFIATQVIQNTTSILTQLKMQSIINFFYGSEDVNSVSSRVGLYATSINAFLSSPLTGVGAYFHSYTVVGNHSQFVDDLARFGFVGGSAILITLHFIRKRLMQNIGHRSLKNAFIYSWFFFLAQGFLNLIYGYAIIFIMFIVLPLCMRVAQRYNLVRRYK